MKTASFLKAQHRISLPFFCDGHFNDVVTQDTRHQMDLSLNPETAIFLSQHVIDGEYVAVANMVIEMLAEAAVHHAEISTGEQYVVHELSDIRLNRMIKTAPDNTKNVTLTTELVPNPDIVGIAIRSTISSRVLPVDGKLGRTVTHASCLVILQVKPLVPGAFVSSSEWEIGTPQTINTAEVYQLIGLARGKRFQNLLENWRIDHATKSIVSNCGRTDKECELIRGNHSTFLTRPIIGDCALQLQLIQAQILTRSLRIPVSIHHYRIFAETVPSAFYRILLKAPTRRDNEICESDITIVSEAGQVVLEIIGSIVQRRPVPDDWKRVDDLFL